MCKICVQLRDKLKTGHQQLKTKRLKTATLNITPIVSLSMQREVSKYQGFIF